MTKSELLKGKQQSRQDSLQLIVELFLIVGFSMSLLWAWEAKQRLDAMWSYSGAISECLNRDVVINVGELAVQCKRLI